MSDSGRRLALAALRLAVAVGLMAAIGVVAHLPLGRPAQDAGLRLALRADRAKIEICRDRSAEELAALPAHMRQARICQETAVDYRLRVVIDDRQRLERTVRHRGVRRNRPLIADELLRLEAGRHRVVIDFSPALEEASPAEGSALPSYRLAETIDFPRGRIRIASLVEQRLRWIPDAAGD